MAGPPLRPLWLPRTSPLPLSSPCPEGPPLPTPVQGPRQACQPLADTLEKQPHTLSGVRPPSPAPATSEASTSRISQGKLGAALPTPASRSWELHLDPPLTSSFRPEKWENSQTTAGRGQGEKKNLFLPLRSYRPLTRGLPFCLESPSSFLSRPHSATSY